MVVIHIDDLPQKTKRKVEASLGVERAYSKADLMRTAGAVLIALNAHNLPMNGQREVLSIVSVWIKGAREYGINHKRSFPKARPTSDFLD